MNKGLQELIELQEVQVSLCQQEECLKRVPQQIDKLKEQLADIGQELEQAELEVEEISKRRRFVEGEVELIRQRLSRFREQLMAVKTNKEYQAVLKEIALAEEEVARSEDQILEQMLAIDEKTELVAEVREQLEVKKGEVDQQRAELEEEEEEAQADIEKLVAARARLMESIPEDLRVIYDRISAVRKGMAMAAVKDGSCQVCHVRLRPQLATELKTNTEKLITCESCNRILYFPNVPVAENPIHS